jgi:hypothetical protein
MLITFQLGVEPKDRLIITCLEMFIDNFNLNGQSLSKFFLVQELSIVRVVV